MKKKHVHTHNGFVGKKTEKNEQIEPGMHECTITTAVHIVVVFILKFIYYYRSADRDFHWFSLCYMGAHHNFLYMYLGTF